MWQFKCIAVGKVETYPVENIDKFMPQVWFSDSNAENWTFAVPAQKCWGYKVFLSKGIKPLMRLWFRKHLLPKEIDDIVEHDAN